MQLKVNGEEIQIKSNPSIYTFLTEEKKLKPEHVVVEYNGSILKREKWEVTQLKNNDILEIVSFVGGG